MGAATTAGAGTGQPDPALFAWCQRVPKVELHLHLEGAIPHPTMLELVRKYDPAGPVADLDTLVERFRYTDFPPEPFAPVYQRAGELGLHTTVHAGEAAGPASVWGGLSLEPERIGHGTRAAEDPRLVEHLAANRIPLEMCPVSNVRTAVVPSVAAHPISQFFAAGIPVTVNTDDPAMFDTSLALEYALLVEQLGFTPDGIRTLVLNAVHASWLPGDRRTELAAEIAGHPAWSAPAS